MIRDTHWFCTECGTRLRAMSWPDDDYRCPESTCKEYDKTIED